MLEVVQLPLGVYQANCYLAARAGSSTAAVIDPGDEPEAVLRALEQRGLAPEAVLVTHCHVDHIGAVAGVARATGAPVYAPREEADELRRHPSAPYEPDRLLEGGEEVAVAGIAFETFLVPGHTRASIAYFAEDCLFSGDVLFAGSIGRTDLAGGDLRTLLESIGRLLAALGPRTQVFPGHGPPTTLERERAQNPFLESLRA
jgi:hydroxyacylglutathione hydrolase